MLLSIIFVMEVVEVLHLFFDTLAIELREEKEFLGGRLALELEEKKFLDFMVDSQKAVPGEVGLFVQERVLARLFPFADFPLRAFSLAREVLPQNLPQNQLQCRLVFACKKYLLFTLSQIVVVLLLVEMRKEVLHLKLLVGNHFDQYHAQLYYSLHFGVGTAVRCQPQYISELSESFVHFESLRLLLV